MPVFRRSKLLSWKVVNIYKFNPLMPDADNNFGGSLGLDFRKWWRHVQPKNWLAKIRAWILLRACLDIQTLHLALMRACDWVIASSIISDLTNIFWMYMKQAINLLMHFALLYTNKTQKVHATLIHIISKFLAHDNNFPAFWLLP